MKKIKIAIKPEGSIEGVLSLSPAIAALKSLQLEAEIGIVAEACFREAASLVPGVEFFFSELPGEGAYQVYDFSGLSGESWGLESSDWKSYIQGCANLSANPYHQIDLTKKAAKVDTTDVNFELVIPECDSLPESVTGGESLRIALCASSLSINQLQSVLEGISRLDISVAVHLIGTIPDKRKSSLLLSAWDGRLALIDLCGRQSLTETAATLRLCDIAITAPGSSALMSSGYGTFTICVDETRNPLHYPYGHGHLVIQHTDSDEFFHALSGITNEIIQFALRGNGGNIPSLDQWQSFADERMDNFLSRIRLLATQRIETLQPENGSFTELYLRPLIFLGSEYDDVLQSFSRLLWENSLSGRNLVSNDLTILHQNTAAAVRADLKPLEQLYELANFGRTYSLYIQQSLTKDDQKKAQHDADRLQETEELIHMLGKTSAAVAPLVAYHAKRQFLLPEIAPLDLADQMKTQFEDMQARVLVLLDLAQSLFHTTLQNDAALAAVPEVDTNG